MKTQKLVSGGAGNHEHVARPVVTGGGSCGRSFRRVERSAWERYAPLLCVAATISGIAIAIYGIGFGRHCGLKRLAYAFLGHDLLHFGMNLSPTLSGKRAANWRCPQIVERTILPTAIQGLAMEYECRRRRRRNT